MHCVAADGIILSLTIALNQLACVVGARRGNWEGGFAGKVSAEHKGEGRACS